LYIWQRFKLFRELLKRIQEVSALPEEAKNQVFLVMDALIRDFKAKQAYAL
jgi:hypothetical protein